MAEKSIKVKVNEILENNENGTAAGAEKTEQPKTVTVSYSLEELAAFSSQLFGVQPECVVAAFFTAGKEEATEEEAKKIVSDFMNKEVK